MAVSPDGVVDGLAVLWCGAGDTVAQPECDTLRMQRGHPPDRMRNGDPTNVRSPLFVGLPLPLLTGYAKPSLRALRFTLHSSGFHD